MDTFVENSGVAEQENKIRVVPTESEKQIHHPIENAETADDTAEFNSQGEEPAQDIKIVRAEKPDPLGRNIANSPLNEIKAGYGYAFRRGVSKR